MVLSNTGLVFSFLILGLILIASLLFIIKVKQVQRSKNL